MDPSHLIVRPAEAADMPSVLEIYNEAVLTTTATYDVEPRTLEHRLQWFHNHERTGHPVFVASLPGRGIVGWSSLNPHHDRPGYRFTTENSVYVAADSRGQGVGKALLHPVVAAARERGFRTVLALIDAENEPSLRLHAAFGFEKAAHFKQVGFKFGRWLDVIYMQLLFPLPPNSPA
jgi:L-amino acid N-acyltransferase